MKHVIFALLLVSLTSSLKWLLTDIHSFEFEVQNRFSTNESPRYVGYGYVSRDFVHIFSSLKLTKDQTRKDHGHFGHNGVSTNYTYSNGKFLRNRQCVTSVGDVPPEINFEKIVLEHTEITDRYTGRLQHETFDEIINSVEGKKYVFDYSGLTYVLVTQNNGLPRYIISQEFVLEITRFDRISVEEYEIAKNNKLNERIFEHCSNDEVARKKQSYYTKQLVPWFQDPKICQYRWLSSQKHCSEYNDAKKSHDDNNDDPQPKDCVFIHGVGITEDQSGPPVTSWPFYWGSLEKYVTQNCKTVTFIREESQMRGWNSEELQRAVCGYLVDDESMIKDKIIFTHSMGNLVLGAAILNDHCKIDPFTTSWYTLSSPSRGSECADYVIDLCKRPSEWTDPVRKLAQFLDYCYNGTHAFPSYYTMTTEFMQSEHAKEVAGVIDMYSTGRLCGSSGHGLNTYYSLYFDLIEELSPLTPPDDGMVSQTSCMNGNEKENLYTPYWEDVHYLARVNHVDSTGRNGNGYYGSDRQPCNYLSNKY